MSEKELSQAELIEKIIARQLKPFIILASILITIFGIIAVPIASQVINLTSQQADIANKVDKKVDSDEAYRNFLPKGLYHIMQKYEHVCDLDAIRNPANADYIYMRHNMNEAERLEIRDRGATSYKEDYEKAVQTN